MSAPLAITMGDASGIGPEIVLRRFCEGGLGDDVVVYGDASILRHGASLLGLDVDWGRLPIVDLALLTAADHRPGQLDAASARRRGPTWSGRLVMRWPARWPASSRCR